MHEGFDGRDGTHSCMLMMAAYTHQAHASMLFDAIERLAGQGLCSRSRAVTAL